jgi:protein-tyrosine phosphatase
MLAAIEIVVLCTGNVCRSPMAEALLRHHMAARGAEATVSSAGSLYDGHRASAHAVTVLGDLGVDISGHRSRRFDRELLGRADLALAMEREHLRQAVVLVPDSFERTFTLKELVRIGERIGHRKPDESVDAWLGRAGIGRRRSDVLGASPDDDVADPIGRPIEDYERTAAELDDLTSRLVDLLWGKAEA